MPHAEYSWRWNFMAPAYRRGVPIGNAKLKPTDETPTPQKQKNGATVCYSRPAWKRFL
jgi:hypothetical protein